MWIKQLTCVPAPVLLAALLLVGCVGPTGPTVEPTVPSTTAPAHTPAFHPTPTALTTPAPTSTPTPALPTPTPVLPTPTPLPDAVVRARALNLRAGPGTEYKILDSYKRGVALEVLGKSPDGDWLKVRAPDGNVGWMALSYLQLNRPLADVEVVEVPPASVKIIRCRDEWFFAGGPDECPGGPAITSAGAEEHFEHGVMIWIGAMDRIYVLYGDGMYPRWEVFPDDFEEGMPESDPTIVPPPGLYQPIRGFGKVWREKPWVRVRLGWAVNREVGFKTAVQFTSRNVTYIRALDGGVWNLEPEAGGWAHVP